MRIILAGEVYSPNLGDRVIADCVSAVLEEVLPNTELTLLDWALRNEEFVFNNTIEEPRQKRHVIDFVRSNIHGPMKSFTPYTSLVDRVRMMFDARKVRNHYTRALSGADLLIIGGGQLLMDNHLVFPVRLSEMIRLAEIYRVPVIFYGVGVGGKWSRRGKDLVAQSLSSPQIKGIGVRDNLSAERLHSIFPDISVPVIKGLDAALLSIAAYDLKKLEPKLAVGVGVINPEVVRRDKPWHPLARKDAADFWVCLCTNLLQKGKNVFLFSNGEKGDQDFVEQIANKLCYTQIKCVGTMRVAQRPTSALNLVELIRSFEGVIAARMHANIIATSLSIPSIGLVSDEKMSSFFFDIHQSDRGVVEFDAPDKIADEFLTFLKAYPNVRDDMIEQWNCELMRTAKQLVSLAI